jgi:hypothetical protein
MAVMGVIQHFRFTSLGSWRFRQPLKALFWSTVLPMFE